MTPSESKKFRSDALWNIASLGLLGVCGVGLNTIVWVFYDPAALGIFNKVYAAYIIFAQFAVGGVHYSVLRRVAAAHGDDSSHSTTILAGLAAAAGLASVFTAAFLGFRSLIAAYVEAPAVATGIAWASPGLFLFALNKVLLHAFNGLRWMKLYAVLQATRPALWLGTATAFGLLGISADTLPAAFTIAEVVVFFVSIACIAPVLPPVGVGIAAAVSEHLRFGVRSFGSGLLSELNTRIDVLMLWGFAVADSTIGVYTFAAFLAEGFYQLLVVFRTNYNPIFARLSSTGDHDEIARIAARGKRKVYALAAALSLVAVLTYPLAAQLLRDPDKLIVAWPWFAALMLGITLSAGYVPLGDVLLQSGRPGLHSVRMSVLVLTNIVLNALCIPTLGALGAALATGTAFAVAAPTTAIFARRALGLKL